MSDDLGPAALRGGDRRWVVPALAVAVVLFVAGAAFAIPLLSDDDDLGDARVRHTGGYGDDTTSPAVRPRTSHSGGWAERPHSSRVKNALCGSGR